MLSCARTTDGFQTVNDGGPELRDLRLVFAFRGVSGNSIPAVFEVDRLGSHASDNWKFQLNYGSVRSPILTSPCRRRLRRTIASPLASRDPALSRRRESTRLRFAST